MIRHGLAVSLLALTVLFAPGAEAAPQELKFGHVGEPGSLLARSAWSAASC